MNVSATPFGCNEDILAFMDTNTSHWLLPEEYRIRDNSLYIELLKRALHEAIENDLNEVQREYFVRHYFKGQKQCQIADEIGIDSKLVNKTIKRAKNCIRDRLDYYSGIYKRIERAYYNEY